MSEIGGMNLEDLTLENIGVWPLPVKIILTVVLCVGILTLGYFLDISKGLKRLQMSKFQELQLRHEFELKQSRAANLAKYQKQMIAVDKMLRVLLHQLPSKTEVPGLLEDISKLGQGSGLEFTLIRPMKSVEKEFFTELPIQITVVGTYHQFAEFISHLSKLGRIVVVGDFTVAPEKKKSDSQAGESFQPPKLEMSLVAKTYHYTEPSEISQEFSDSNAQKDAV